MSLVGFALTCCLGLSQPGVLGLVQPGVATPGARPDGVEAVVEVRATEAQLRLRTDLDAMLLGLPTAASATQRVLAMEALRGDELEAAVDRLRHYLSRRLRLRFDGVVAALRVEFPREARTPDEDSLLTLGGVALLVAERPPEARTISFFASRSFGGVTLMTRTANGTVRQSLEPGERSEPVVIRPAQDG